MNETVVPDIGGMETSLAKIDSTLREFWKSFAESDADPVLRASTMNLIMVVRTPEQYKEASQVVPDLINHHPGRIILAYVHENNKNATLKAFISAHCQLQRHVGRQICCEQIILTCPQAEEEYLAGAILPLLLSDLPVFLWWPGLDLACLRCYQRLLPYIDRLVFSMPDYCATDKALGEYFAQIAAMDLIVSEMAWSRLTPWREAIARFFDGADGTASLSGLQTVTLHQAGSQTSSTALLLMGWLAAQLNWTFIRREPEAGQWIFTNPAGRQVVLNLTPNSKGNQYASVHSIELVTQVHKEQILSVAEMAASDHMRLRTNLGPKLIQDNYMAISSKKSEHALCGELDFLHGDALYAKVIRVLSRVLT